MFFFFVVLFFCGDHPGEIKIPKLLNAPSPEEEGPKQHRQKERRSVGDGISVDPPLHRGSAQVYSPSTKGQNCEGEKRWKIVEVGERERVDVLSDECCKG